jgi:hypothetical protein
MALRNRKNQFFKLALLVACIFLMATSYCATRLLDGWLDNGCYLCPDCQDHAVLRALHPCERCGYYTSMSFIYCYDCAKELARCQRCGRER